MYELDEPAGSDWDDLAGLLGSGSVADLFTAEVGPPRGWGPAFFESAGFQTVLDRPLTAPVEADPLVPGDVPDVPALVEQTRPGPFGERTIEMGAFYGVRESGVLIAIGGADIGLPPGGPTAFID
jgi:hypothetical protein